MLRSSIAVILLSAALTGCVSSGRDITANQISQISVGQTTRADLQTIFGQPTAEVVNSDGSSVVSWGYFYSGYAGVGTQSKAISVVIGPDGRVERYSQAGIAPAPARFGR